MGEFIASHLLEIVFGLLSAGALAFCKYLWSRNKKLEEMQKADQNRQYRDMILDEIEPLTVELKRIWDELKNQKTKTDQEFTQIKLDSELAHQAMYRDLQDIQAGNSENFELIINSYKYRLIQLCRSHIKDGYITQADYEQVSEMHTLYTALGGNGQAEEYYQKVLKLEIR